MTNIFVLDDGGRLQAGWRGDTGDCFVRALSIASEMPYNEARQLVVAFAAREKRGKRKRKISSPSSGVYARTARRIMDHLGWQWIATMRIGSGCTTHLFPSELPSGRLICRVSKHFVAVIDGVIHDTYDPMRGGTRCVYGYWIKQ